MPWFVNTEVIFPISAEVKFPTPDKITISCFASLSVPSVGKTWLAFALAPKPCREGYTAQIIRLTRLLRELMIAKGDGRYAKLLANLAKVDVLILDDGA